MIGKLRFGGRGYSQVTYSHIRTCYLGMGFRCWVCYFDFQTDEQVELLPGFVIPQLGSTKMGIGTYQGHVLVISRIGKDDTSLQGQDAHSLRCLETVVMTQLV